MYHIIYLGRVILRSQSQSNEMPTSWWRDAYLVTTRCLSRNDENGVSKKGSKNTLFLSIKKRCFVSTFFRIRSSQLSAISYQFFSALIQVISYKFSVVSYSMRWLTFHFSLLTFHFFSALTCDFIFHCLINHFYNENPLYITFIISILQSPQNTPWTTLACEK